VLTRTLLLDVDGIQVVDVACSGGGSRWAGPEAGSANAMVFVRRGCFRRRAAGSEDLVDPGVVYFERPGEEQEIAHPVDGGDVCTAVGLPDEVLATVAGGEPVLPGGSVFSSPDLDWAHRVMVSRCRRWPDDFEATERVVVLAAGVLQRAGQPGVESGRPATGSARRRMVDDTREALAADPDLSLLSLARAVAVSPHHLSRIFRARTGATLSRYRNRLRVRAALERLAEGERDLATLAADLRFADHAHLVRTMRQELGATPSAVRALLASSN
jgi:AraC-like DNA-binding protein